ncbi:MAG: hypothetical protein L6R38_005945 [Xanthoria sp. 2 TBL-2021]|nr:MAG: hypothetical protein L6R38_005945 [Xanthoria sp. 2 TBL-2021]
MTAAFGSELVIPGITKAPEYNELYAFSIAKDLAKNYGEYFSAHDLLLIVCRKDWAKYKNSPIEGMQSIMDYMEAAEDENTPAWRNYLQSYNHVIEHPEDYIKEYRELREVRTAYEKLRYGDILLLAWSRYWTTNVSSKKVMDAISLKRRSQGELAFAPRSDLIDRELQNWVCYKDKPRFRTDFLLAVDNHTPTVNVLMVRCKQVFMRFLPNLTPEIKDNERAKKDNPDYV